MTDKKITVWHDDKEQEAEIISVFEIPEFGKEYVVYTFNEMRNDSIKVLVSTLRREGDNYIFENIATEEEWKILKEKIKEVAQKGKEVENE